jgi:hypothetical protein
VRANAALLSEVGGLLQKRTPPKGKHASWLEQARAYTAAAEAVAQAAERRDYPGTRRAFKALSARCAACHAEHR